MRSHMLCLCLLFAACFSAHGQNYTCAPYNRAAGPFYYGSAGYDQHVTGNHQWAVQFGGTGSSTAGCYYAYQGSPYHVCAVHAVASAFASAYEYGKLNTLLDIHEVSSATHQGSAWSNGPAVSADSEGAAAARSCWPSCGVSIGITGTGTGGGFSVTYPPDNIFADQQHFLVSCAGQRMPVRNTCYPNCPSPIVIATKPRTDMTKGFSNPEERCVMFDLKNDGHPQCYSWPKRHSGVGFLVYDRDKDGDVDKGSELFGTFTPGADGSCVGEKLPPEAANGFLALGCLDNNHDLQITAQDAKFAQLKVWLPDHCWDAPETPCVSIRTELHSLTEYGIHSLSVMYSPSQIEDKWGNQFKYYAQTNPKPHDLQLPDDELNERRMWDVWLVPRK